MKSRVLVVDDDPFMCQLVETCMSSAGMEVESALSGADAFERMKTAQYDTVLTDLNMPGMNGLDLTERIVANWPHIPVVVITAFASLETAIAAIRVGAYDFVTKPVEMDMLTIVLQRALDKHALQEKVRRLSATVSEMRHYGRLIGASPQIRQLYEQIARIADSDTSVLIVGESGTGKELAARTIHEQSRRRTGAFVGVNCASLPAPLLESELFGHVRGAFTDAREERKGLFLQADNGTILLDDVIDFPLSLQPKVLRVIQERMLRPVGSDSEVPFNARIVATANRDLESEVEEGRFREDLFYRINVVQLEMPPLRSRGADILLLAQHFLEHFRDANGKEVAEISDAVAERLLAYNWPGNVRELRNAMERAVALTRYDSIRIEDLPEKIKAYKTTQFSFGGPDPAELPSLEAIERQYILHVMATTRGNRSEAAKRLGLDRKTLYRKLISYGSMDATPERE